MARYVIDAPTLIHLVGGGRAAAPGHQLVAPGGIRSEAMQTLLLDVRRGARTDSAARALVDAAFAARAGKLAPVDAFDLLFVSGES